MAESKPHVVLVPSSLQGHLIPFLELAKLLTSLGLAVSYVPISVGAQHLEPQVQCSNLDIQFVTLTPPSSEEPSPGTQRSGNVSFHVTALEQMAGPFEEWLNQQMNNNADPPRASPTCIISDFFSKGWVHISAEKLGISSVAFYTMGAYSLSVLHAFVTACTPQNIPQGDDEIFEIPGLNFAKLRMSDFPPGTRHKSKGWYSPLIEEINRGREKKQMILINTFEGIDSSGIDHMKSLTGQPVLNIGPLLPPAVFDRQGIDRGRMNILRGEVADIDDETCLRWLDSQRPESVVFVCFGSMFIANHEQLFELLTGLDASGHAFILASRLRDTVALQSRLPDTVALPEGRRDEYKNESSGTEKAGQTRCE